MAHQMANSCVGCDAPIISHSPRYPSPLSEIDAQLELTTPSSSSWENTATTCDTTANGVVYSQERTPQNDTSDGSDEAISQDIVQYSTDEHQLALNLQQLSFSREPLQQYVPSYTAIQGNASHIHYSVGPTVASQSPPHAPVDAYHPLLAAPRETSQYRGMIVSQPHPYVSSSAHNSTVHPSQVPGYIGPYVLSEQFYQQQQMPTPLSTPHPHQMTIPRHFPSAPLNIPANPSQPMGQPNMETIYTPVSTRKRGRSEIRKHPCNVCNKFFLRPSALQTHIFTHTGEKPHSCPVPGCDRHGEGKGFSVRSNMTRHVRARHKDWTGVINRPSAKGVTAAQGT